MAMPPEKPNESLPAPLQEETTPKTITTTSYTTAHSWQPPTLTVSLPLRSIQAGGGASLMSSEHVSLLECTRRHSTSAAYSVDVYGYCTQEELFGMSDGVGVSQSYRVLSVLNHRMRGA